MKRSTPGSGRGVKEWREMGGKKAEGEEEEKGKEETGSATRGPLDASEKAEPVRTQVSYG